MAIAFYEQAIARDPKYALAYSGLASSYVLEQSYADRDGAKLSWINVEPIIDPLDGDPRFQALVPKMIAPKSEAKALTKSR